MLRFVFLGILGALSVMGCSSPQSLPGNTIADAGPDSMPEPCVGEFVTIGAACAPNGATCGVCMGPPGPLYVCDKGQWRGEIIGFCDDNLPPDPCAKCSTYLDDPNTSLCGSSVPIYDAFKECACTRKAADPMPGCAEACASSYCAGLASDAACMDCMTKGACVVDYTSCRNDI